MPVTEILTEILIADMTRTTWNAGPSLTPDPAEICDICGAKSKNVATYADGVLRCKRCHNRAFDGGQFRPRAMKEVKVKS